MTKEQQFTKTIKDLIFNACNATFGLAAQSEGKDWVMISSGGKDEIIIYINIRTGL